MKLAQVKFPELAMDGMMAYMGVQLDHPNHTNGPTDSFAHGNPDVLPGAILGGLHGAVALGGLIGAGVSADGGETDQANQRLTQGLWESAKAGGFAMQIAPSLGVIGAGMVACATLGDLCSGWATAPIRDWSHGRQAAKNSGPRGCQGPED